jgi:hypothetical protein
VVLTPPQDVFNSGPCASVWGPHHREDNMPRALNDGTPLTDAEFIIFLEQTLIPDLQESGFYSTAEDFQRCVEIKHQGYVKE